MNETNILLTDDLKIDLVRRQVFKSGVKVKVSDLSYRTLLVLLENAPNVVSVDQLIEQVWQGVKVSQETVTQRIALLRKSISNNQNQHDRYIVSVRSQGYRLVTPVKEKRSADLNINIRYTVIAILTLIISSGIFLWFSNGVQKTDKPIVVNAVIQSDDFNKRGRRYLSNHDAKNNRLAIEMFEKSLQEKANNLDALVGLSFAYSHEVSKFNQSNKLLENAILLAEKATQLYPEESKAWNALGFAHDVNGDIDTAISHYKASLDLNPQSSSAQAAIAYLHGIKGELVQSLKMNLLLLDSGLEYSNLQLAENLHLLGFVELADQWYQRADVLSPSNVFASNQRVRFLISNQRYQEAQLLLDQIKEKGINRPETHTLQGILQLIRGNKSLALASFAKALKINNEDFEAQVWGLILSDEIEHKIKALEDMWLHKEYYWPSDVINKVILYAALGERDKMMAGLKDAFDQGYMDSQWLLQLPPIKHYLSDTEFLFWIDQIQQKAGSQRQELLTVSWLPSGFLDPASSNQ